MIKKLHWYHFLMIIGLVIITLSTISLIIFMNITSSKTTNPELLVTIALVLFVLIGIGSIMTFIGVVAIISYENLDLWIFLIIFLIFLPLLISDNYSIYIKILEVSFFIAIFIIILLRRLKIKKAKSNNLH